MSGVVIFIAGIFAGWIAEWLFFTFIVKKESDSKSEVVSVKKEKEPAIKVEAKPKAAVKPITEIKAKTEVKPKVAEKPKTIAKTKESTKKASTKKDNFTTFKGVGPKLASSLSDAGIQSFSQLKDYTGDELIAKLEKSGAKITNKQIVADLPKQAELAAKNA